VLEHRKTETFFRRHVALPSDHGSWVFLLSPLLIGMFVGGQWTTASALLIIGALAAFLLRQPFTIATKVYAGRRSRRDLPAARLWISIYGLIAILALSALVAQGFHYLFKLILPGVFVFIWYLWLVSKRSERHQLGVNIIASGALALAAPAALWVSVGEPIPLGWWLWALIWLQSAASIVHAFMRLDQRIWQDVPKRSRRIIHGGRALLYTGFNLVTITILSANRIMPAWLWLPYGLQFAETLWGTIHPAIGVKPTRIGMRQLLVSILFTILFILAWGA
jgi:hypothetical protein